MAARLPSLNALRAFEAVARVGSVSGAAEELRVTAGAVSRLVKTLEADLGVRLLERDGRGVKPTALARRAQPELSAGFGGLANAVAALRAGSRERPLTLEVEPVFASAWLVGRLGGFRELAPSVELRIDATRPEPDARRATTDVAILYGEVRQAGLDAVGLIDEEIFPVCSPELSRSSDPIECPADLLKYTLLHYDDAPASWRWPSWSDWLAAVGGPRIEAKRGPRMVAGTSIMEAARGGQGVALACTSIAMDDLAAGRLVRPTPEVVPAEIGYVVATKPADRDRADLATFRRWLIATIRRSRGDRGPERTPGLDLAAPPIEPPTSRPRKSRRGSDAVGTRAETVAVPRQIGDLAAMDAEVVELAVRQAGELPAHALHPPIGAQLAENVGHGLAPLK